MTELEKVDLEKFELEKIELEKVELKRKIPVAILGATGSVGQKFITLLTDHPWFEIQALTASPRSVGKRYADAAPWIQNRAMPKAVRDLELRPTEAQAIGDCQIAFSALGSDVAAETEEAVAEAGLLVVSNAGAHRMDPDVPLIVPEVNPDHLDLIDQQRFERGGILTNPNCSTIGLVMALKPLAEAFGLKRVHAVTLQAVSGAGLPGVPSVKIIDNLIPYIPREEEKIENESRKILGSFNGTAIDPLKVGISAACNRVPVIDGHTICASVELARPVSEDEVRAAWEHWTAEPQALQLPTAPARPTVYLDGLDEPQPRLHRDVGGGMAATVGRLRPCPLFDYKFVTLTHNTLRGAAGCALLVGELAVARGLLERRGIGL